MNEIIKDCYLKIFDAIPEDEVINEIKDNLPVCVSYIIKELGLINNEVEDLIYLFIHSNYK